MATFIPTDMRGAINGRELESAGKLSGIVKVSGRLDKVSVSLFPTLSRARVQALIAGGAVKLNDQITRLNRAETAVGDRVEITVPPAVPAEPLAENIALNIVFEDEHMLVIDKPVGLVVHPAPGSPDGTLVNALLAHCGDSLSGVGGVKRPGIVHRLDKDTSGLMVVAKSDRAHQGLSAQLSGHTMGRTYLAFVWGAPAPPAGKIDLPIGRHPVDRKKMAVIKSGRAAVTHYRVLENLDGASLLECKLETGRTHQIRVHLSHIGHPLVGDPVYGKGRRPPPIPLARQALHATTIRFIHPVTGKAMEFHSDLPPDLSALKSALGG
jgi:23S rRNA pseudouridine1911/1915/1917 synthase